MTSEQKKSADFYATATPREARKHALRRYAVTNERREGHSRLVYNKATRTIDAVDPHPTTPTQAAEARRTEIARLVTKIGDLAGEWVLAADRPQRNMVIVYAKRVAFYKTLTAELSRLTAELARQTAMVEGMRAVLTPFAMAYNEDHWHSCLSLDNIRAARDALAVRPAVVPEGYVLVPVEPTVAMMKAAWHVIRANKGEDEYICDIYRAMLAARPTPADSGEGK